MTFPFYFILGRPWSKGVLMFYVLSMPMTVILFTAIDNPKTLEVIYALLPTPWMALTVLYVWDIFMKVGEFLDADTDYQHPRID